MAWEKRRGGLFYYRCTRVDGKVVKQYFGKGAHAEFIAEMDASQRATKQAARHAARREEVQLEKLIEPLEAFGRNLDILIQAELLRDGYHNHGGEWRRRRANTTKTKAT